VRPILELRAVTAGSNFGCVAFAGVFAQAFPSLPIISEQSLRSISGVCEPNPTLPTAITRTASASPRRRGRTFAADDARNLAILQRRHNPTIDALAQDSVLSPWPKTHTRASGVQKLDTGFFKDRHDPVERIRPRAHLVIKSLHPLYRSQGDARFP
jgi:hypothetical protein